MTMRIFFSYLTIRSMNYEFRLLIFRNLSCDFNSLILSICDSCSTCISFTNNLPLPISRSYMLIFPILSPHALGKAKRLSFFMELGVDLTYFSPRMLFTGRRLG